MLSAVARVVLLIVSAAPPLGAQTAAPPQPIALRHVNVVDVRGARVLRDRTIVAAGGHIAAVLPPRAALPESARVVDSGGAYAIPGLWDTHVHLSYLGTCALPMFVANGVTSVRDAGVPFLAGTDVGSPPGLYPGASLRDELELLVHDVGLSPARALRAATIEPPTFFGLERTLGEVAAGRVADLLLLDGNPLADVANLRRIRAVMLGGRLLERADLDAALAKVAADVRGRTGCAAELPNGDPPR